MRILLLTGEFPPMQGGVGDCTNEIAKTLAMRGVEVQVLTSVKAQSSEHQAPRTDIHTSSFVVRPIMKSWGWSSYRLILRVIREFQPDLVHIQFQTAAFGMNPAIYFVPSLVRRGGREVKSVTTFHDLNPPYLFPKAGRVREWITQFLASSCVAVITTNDDDYSQLSTLRLTDLALIPIGSNITTSPPSNYQTTAWRKNLGVNEGESLLCYFGFLNESKGGETLIRALALVPNAKLLMIGGQVGASDATNAAYLARVKSLIADLELSERVLWTDYTPPEIVTANLFASDLCVLPYRDGASYRRGSLMAALAHGCAIITTQSRRRAMRNMTDPRSSSAVPIPLLQNERNCLLVEPSDHLALAETVNRALASPELRARISMGARELARNFTWEKIAQQHLDLYHKILD